MKHSSTTWCATLTAALVAALISAAIPSSSLLANPRQLIMSEDERLHVLRAFGPVYRTGGNSTKDTVWARRSYAPMHIHQPALQAYRESIALAFPDHEITFDVIFAAADNAVPWHADYDSLGPFEASVHSIVREDFITVHANLISDGGGSLRTLDSAAIAAVHWLSNRATKSFGSLGALTEPLAAAIGVRTHDATPGVGNAFNNLKAHAVSAGAGRISYVVRLVHRSVLLSGNKLRAAVSGSESTRQIREFEAFLPHLVGERMEAGAFPWSKVLAQVAN